MRTTKFIIYRDKQNLYRWHLKASNGRIIAESGEGYKRKDRCEQAMSDLSGNAYNAKVIDKTKP